MRFYLSHSIRGKHGKDATFSQMRENCNKAILIANLIRNAIPSVEIYCPAEHEDFVNLAYRKHYLTEKQLLDVDCGILENCEGVIVYVPEGDELQGGRKVEVDFAREHSKPVFIFYDVGQVIIRLADYILKA